MVLIDQNTSALMVYHQLWFFPHQVVQINNNLMVLMVRYTKIDRKTLLLSWPVFQFGGTQMHPITEAYKILGQALFSFLIWNEHSHA